MTVRSDLSGWEGGEGGVYLQNPRARARGRNTFFIKVSKMPSPPSPPRPISYFNGNWRKALKRRMQITDPTTTPPLHGRGAPCGMTKNRVIIHCIRVIIHCIRVIIHWIRMMPHGTPRPSRGGVGVGSVSPLLNFLTSKFLNILTSEP